MDFSRTGLAPVAVLSFIVSVLGLGAVGIAFFLSDQMPMERAASVPSEMKAPLATATQTTTTTALRYRPARKQITLGSSAGENLSTIDGTEATIAASTETDVSTTEDLVLASTVGTKRTWPRLKPRRVKAGQEVVKTFDPSAVYLAPETPVAFASADDFTGGRESLFTEYAQARAEDRLERAYETVVLRRGESLAVTLEMLGASSSQVASILSAADEVSPISDLKPGMAIDYAFDTPILPSAQDEILFEDPEQLPKQYLSRLRFRPDSRHIVTAWRKTDGRYTARVRELSVQKRYASVAGVIHHSLFAAAQRSSVPPEIMARFANLFLYDVDFARDIYSGDKFETVYEAYFDEEGHYAGTGEIVFAGMSWKGDRSSRGYYRFSEAKGMEIPYFDATGESASRMLMKTPIEGGRVTSSFGMRRHPVLGYTKAHKGVDFGAPKGTPIMAAGDGKIIRAQMTGSFGHFVQIQHDHGFKTSYAHLNGYAKGIKAGKKVRQGDIIGYVGSTGRSTGPHLHYEVHKGNEVLNPMTIEVANGRTLDGALLTSFDEHREFVDSVRVRPLTVASATNR